MIISPIILFVYNRPRHTKMTVEALQQNTLASQSELVIYSDGPKNAEHLSAVSEVRQYLRGIGGFKSVRIEESEVNRGLANSIIKGVTETVSRFGRVIVLEDDMITSKYYLEYMNNGLNIYENEEKVASIHGYIYPVEKELRDIFFIRGADCWGWATWKRAWDFFENDGRKLLNELWDRKLIHEFDFSGTFPFSRMLKAQIEGKNDSWAIRWYASAFLKDMLTLYPGKSLVFNTGCDGSGTHSGQTGNMNGINDVHDVRINISKIDPIEDRNARQIMTNYFRRQKEPLWTKIRRKTREIFKLS
jgi:hypothetical protein